MITEKVQPHCEVCLKPFKRNDKVHTDTFANQIFHVKCFYFKPEFIKDTGTYEEIVNKYPRYKKVFIISDKPVTSLILRSTLRKRSNKKN